jgi:hypothetical protein
VLTKDEMKRKEEPGKKLARPFHVLPTSCGDQFGPLYDAEAKISQADDSSSYRNLNSQSGKLKK